jgi:hypothetical protein
MVAAFKSEWVAAFRSEYPAGFVGIRSKRRRNFESERETRTREDQMPSILKEALEWLNRAEQAREVAGQLTDPSARKAVLELAESLDRLARAAATPAVLRRRELVTKDQERN